MRKRIATLIAAALLAANAMVAAPAVSAAGLCTVSTQTNNQYAVVKHFNQTSGNRFWFVSGTATVRDLDNCEGPGIGQTMGTALLPANMEGPGTIYQLGVRANTFGMYFVYAYNDDGAIRNWPDPTFIPTFGHTYRFRISLAAAGQPLIYDIWDTNTGEFHNMSIGSSPSLANRPYFLWWGAERLDSVSGIGDQHSGADIDITTMQYRTSGSSTNWTRTGIGSITSTQAGIEAGASIYKNPGLTSCHHGHVKSFTYSNDTFDPDTGC